MKDYILKEDTEKNNLITDPFVRKYSDDEREEDGERLTIRINKEEREVIDFLKDSLNYSQDAKVIKQALKVYQNVIRNTLGVDNALSISAQDRRRPTKSKNPLIQ